MIDETPNKSNRMDPLVGRVFNQRFRIRELVARGGMGKVYKAIQAPLERVVALKVLDPKYTGEMEQNFDERFFMEASISSKLSHPNTVTIFDYGQTDDGLFYIAMEYLEGRTLHQELKNQTTLSIERAIHIAGQICRSVREAHQLNVVHRDLKPANIFLINHGDENDFVKVLDFGLVKNMLEEQSNMTKTGIFMGSPGYMSPEQIRGHALDKRTDVYSLGAMLFEMLTGQPPFVRNTTMDTILAHLSDEVPRFNAVNAAIDIPKVLEQIVRKCLAKDRNQRFESMEKVLHALKLVLKQLGSSMSLSISGDPSIIAENSAVQQMIDHSTDSQSRSQVGTLIEAVPSLSSPEANSSNPTSNSTIVLTEEDLNSVNVASIDHSQPGGIRRSKAHARPSKPGLTAVAIGFLGFTLIGGFVLFTQLPKRATPKETPTTNEAESKPQSAATPSKTPASPATPQTNSAPQAAATTKIPEAVTPQPIEDSVDVIITSSPAGASVYLGSRLLCRATPCELTWRGEAAKRGRVIELRYNLENYRRYTASRTIRGPILEAHARLSKTRVAIKSKAATKKPKVVAKKAKTQKKPLPKEDTGFKETDEEEEEEEAEKKNFLEDYKDNPYKDNPY